MTQQDWQKDYHGKIIIDVSGNPVIVKGFSLSGGHIAEANTNIDFLAPKLLESLEVMTALCRLKFGNLDKDVYAEIEKAEAAIAAAKGQ